MSDPIAVIDLSSAPGEEPSPRTLATLDRAATETGLFQVVGHGVDSDLLAAWDGALDRFFRLSPSVKARSASPTGHPYRGWRAWPADSGHLELERLWTARFDDAEQARRAGVPGQYLDLFEHVNVWPAEAPELAGLARRVRESSTELARRLTVVFARALGVPDGTFAFDGPDTTSLTVNVYPRWSGPRGDDPKLLLFEHTDGSVLTVLHQRGEHEGLQVAVRGEEWTTVPVVPGALIVNLGTLLRRWTNDRWRAGQHRVVGSPAGARTSTGIFYQPSLTTVVRPLEPFVGSDGPHYEPLSVAQAQRDFVESFFTQFDAPAEQLAAWREQRPFVAEYVT